MNSTTVSAGPTRLRSGLRRRGAPLRQTSSAVGSPGLPGAVTGTPGPCLTISGGRALPAGHAAGAPGPAVSPGRDPAAGWGWANDDSASPGRLGRVDG